LRNGALCGVSPHNARPQGSKSCSASWGAHAVANA
jgi:hypothetical protein